MNQTLGCLSLIPSLKIQQLIYIHINSREMKSIYIPHSCIPHILTHLNSLISHIPVHHTFLHNSHSCILHIHTDLPFLHIFYSCIPHIVTSLFSTPHIPTYLHSCIPHISTYLHFCIPHIPTYLPFLHTSHSYIPRCVSLPCFAAMLVSGQGSSGNP